MKNHLLLILLMLSAAFLGGCNTTQGFGQDVEAAGDTIEEVAEETEEEIDDM